MTKAVVFIVRLVDEVGWDGIKILLDSDNGIGVNGYE